MKLFRALLAHCDQGADRVIEDVRQRLPGKEIWVTEWNTVRGRLPNQGRADPGDARPARLAHDAGAAAASQGHDVAILHAELPAARPGERSLPIRV